MTEQEFIDRFLASTNALRIVLNEEPLTYEKLKSVGVAAVQCSCSDPTCKGWVMALPAPEHGIKYGVVSS